MKELHWPGYDRDRHRSPDSGAPRSRSAQAIFRDGIAPPSAAPRWSASIVKTRQAAPAAGRRDRAAAASCCVRRPRASGLMSRAGMSAAVRTHPAGDDDEPSAPVATAMVSC